MFVQIVFVVAAALAGYVLSLWLHPYTTCRSCKGSSKHTGGLFRYGYRPCRRCKGSGRRVRMGCHVFRPALAEK